MEIFWEAKDTDGWNTECELVKISDTKFQLSLDNGPFSGYPTINLDRKNLKDLHDAIEHLMGWRKEP